MNLGSSKSAGRASQELYRIEAKPGATSFRFRYAVQAVRYVEVLAPRSPAVASPRPLTDL